MFAKLARTALILTVTAGIFFVSASHIVEVATKYGNTGAAAFIYPLCIDGVILISALTLVATQGAVGKETKMWATVARYFGFIATIYCNVEHSGYGSLSAILVNVIPAVALIFTMEITVNSVKAMARTAARTQRTKAAAGRHHTDNVRPLRSVA